MSAPVQRPASNSTARKRDEGEVGFPVLLRDWLAEAWEEGYESAITDTEARSAPPGPCGPVDPSRNPYRSAS